MTDDMKRLLPLAAALLLAAGCQLKTATYTDEQTMPLEEGRTDSLFLSVSLEYPVKGADEEALVKMTSGILNTAFDMEDIDPASVEETALRYEENLKDEYFNENGEPAAKETAEVLSWEDRVNGYFSGYHKRYATYMVEYYGFRGGAHGISTMTPVVFDTRTGEIVHEEDLFEEGYFAPVSALIQSRLPDALDNNEENLSALFEPDLVGPNGNFEVGADGVTWYYQPYDIAPFYLGVISVTVPWSALKPWLRK